MIKISHENKRDFRMNKFKEIENNLTYVASEFIEKSGSVTTKKPEPFIKISPWYCRCELKPMLAMKAKPLP